MILLVEIALTVLTFQNVVVLAVPIFHTKVLFAPIFLTEFALSALISISY